MIFLFDIIVLALVIGSDLVSKELICGFLKGLPENQHESYVLLDKIFTLTYRENTGASFGSFAGNQAMLIAVTSIVMIALIGLLIWQKGMPKMLRTAVLLIVGGGIGNLVDRIAFDYVRDFIDYTFIETIFGSPFAIGNVADIYLCVGVLLVIIYVLFAFDEKDFSMKWRKEECK